MRAKKQKEKRKMKKIYAISAMLLITFSTLAMFSLMGNAQEPPEQLTTNPWRDSHPSWHPDGTKIAYNAFSDSWYRNVWVMDSDGSGKDPLASGNVINEAPAFSPDGTKIAFTHWGYRGDYHDLMIMNADGTGIERITFSGISGMVEGTYEVPQWSKDGSTLIFGYGEGTTGMSKPWWIGSVRIDGSELQVINDVRGLNPRFCYDDTKIIFNTDPFLGDMRIAIMNADGTGLEYLTDGPIDWGPDMSAISHRIVFTRGNPGDLYVMSADGSNKVPLTSDGESHESSWSPDEKYIAYTHGIGQNYDIWKIEALSSECTLSLVPNTGFASTTVVGSGFSSNSEMTITWDDTEMPPVPNPLITNSYGNFTTIISVPTQNDAGSHIIKATDEFGNEANATFHVLEMAVSQGETRELSLLVDASTIGVSIIAICLATIALFRSKKQER